MNASFASTNPSIPATAPEGANATGAPTGATPTIGRLAAYRDVQRTATLAEREQGREPELPAADDPAYKLVIAQNVVEKIASLAAQKIDGIVDMRGNVLSRIQEGLGGDDKTKGVSADLVDDNTAAELELDVILEYGASAPDVFEEIKHVVGHDLHEMAGLAVAEMTVNVVDVETPDERDKRTGADEDDEHEQAAA